MEQYEYRHNLTVGHAAGTVAMTLSRHLNGMFFNSGAKNLQNSSRIQKISIKFAVVMGMGVCS